MKKKVKRGRLMRSESDGGITLLLLQQRLDYDRVENENL